MCALYTIPQVTGMLISSSAFLKLNTERSCANLTKAPVSHPVKTGLAVLRKRKGNKYNVSASSVSIHSSAPNGKPLNTSNQSINRAQALAGGEGIPGKFTWT